MDELRLCDGCLEMRPVGAFAVGMPYCATCSRLAVATDDAETRRRGDAGTLRRMGELLATLALLAAVLAVGFVAGRDYERTNAVAAEPAAPIVRATKYQAWNCVVPPRAKRAVRSDRSVRSVGSVGSEKARK